MWTGRPFISPSSQIRNPKNKTRFRRLSGRTRRTSVPRPSPPQGEETTSTLTTLPAANATRVRLHPYVQAGFADFRLTAGVLFPNHGAVGARVHQPLLGSLLLTLQALYGSAPERTYADGTPWQAGSVASISAGLGLEVP